MGTHHRSQSDWGVIVCFPRLLPMPSFLRRAPCMAKRLTKENYRELLNCKTVSEVAGYLKKSHCLQQGVGRHQ